MVDELMRTKNLNRNYGASARLNRYNGDDRGRRISQIRPLEQAQLKQAIQGQAHSLNKQAMFLQGNQIIYTLLF
jgi:hypothetical protein